jgi:membrane protease YdiL (CAAX protease family)
MKPAAATPRAGITMPLFAILVAPFYLNDFASIYVADWRWWLAIDYVGVKALPLALLIWILRSGRVTGDDLGLGVGPLATAIIAFFLAATIGTLIDQNAYTLLEDLPGYPPLGGMPAITSATWNWIDLTLGLLLVGVVEELVFRAAAFHVLSRYTANSVAIVLASSCLFGLIHWSLGLHAVVITTVIGAVFMMVYLRSRQLLPIAIAHFVVNFVDFAGVVPKSVFRFF